MLLNASTLVQCEPPAHLVFLALLLTQGIKHTENGALPREETGQRVKRWIGGTSAEFVSQAGSSFRQSSQKQLPRLQGQLLLQLGTPGAALSQRVHPCLIQQGVALSYRGVMFLPVGPTEALAFSSSDAHLLPRGRAAVAHTCCFLFDHEDPYHKLAGTPAPLAHASTASLCWRVRKDRLAQWGEPSPWRAAPPLSSLDSVASAGRPLEAWKTVRACSCYPFHLFSVVDAICPRVPQRCKDSQLKIAFGTNRRLWARE